MIHYLVVRTADADHIHKEVTKYYDLPHLSLIDGLGPFYTKESN